MLDFLTHEKLMDQEPGSYAAQILRSCSCNDRDRKLLDKLENARYITSRPSRSDERADKYYYVTDDGIQFKENLAKMR